MEDEGFTGLNLSGLQVLLLLSPLTSLFCAFSYAFSELFLLDHIFIWSLMLCLVLRFLRRLRRLF